MYLIAIIDVYSRYIVGWSLSNREIGMARRRRECLEEAIMRHGAPGIINTGFSDPEFAVYFSSYPGLKFSMDGKRRAIDNIFIERFRETSNTKRSISNHLTMI